MCRVVFFLRVLPLYCVVFIVYFYRFGVNKLKLLNVQTPPLWGCIFCYFARLYEACSIFAYHNICNMLKCIERQRPRTKQAHRTSHNRSSTTVNHIFISPDRGGWGTGTITTDTCKKNSATTSSRINFFGYVLHV